MNVQVAAPAKMSGQVANGQIAGTRTEQMETVKANVKVMDGKRYVWVPGQLGSQIGGRWVEEGSDEARLSTTNQKGRQSEELRNMQNRSGEQFKKGG